MIRISGLLTIAAIAMPLEAAPVAIDGQFDEWQREHLVAVDPAGDADGAFDLTYLALFSQGSVVHVSFDTGRVLNLQSGDASDGTLAFTFRAVRTGREIRIDTRNRAVTIAAPGQAARETNWHEVGYWSAPTFASARFEFRVDLTEIEAGPGDAIEVTITGSDTLDDSIRIELDQNDPSDQSAPFVLQDPIEGQLRVVSLNTLRNGIVHPERAAPLLRLIKAPKPDIVLLQEEYNTSNADIRAAIEGKLGGQWNIVRVRDNVILSPLPLTQIASFNDAYAAAIVTPDDQAPRLILCVHPKCCGYIGSDEDRRRIEETQAMMQTISIARQRFGDDLAVLLAGDWNLVGSRSPLDLLTSPAGSDLRLLEARNPATESVYTWFAPRSAFGPGLLDLATVSARSAESSEAQILNTRTIDEASLRKLGLFAEDSEASDHMMLIIDFGA